MCTSDFCPDDELSDDTTATHSPAVTKAVTRPDIGRRTFLKAAALGTAAAALTRVGSGGFGFGPLSALADDLSTFQCTANDVRIVGPGQILNEPCGCAPGTPFDAQVAFTVENNAASDRGCITLHLVPGKSQSGQTITIGDIILADENGVPVVIPGKTSPTVIITIKDYPCGSGLVSFGSASGDGRRRCDPGECSTVSWTVPGQDNCPPDKQISSKCRHQLIQIQGRGVADLACTTPDCKVDCNGTTTLKLSTTGGVAPFLYELYLGNTLVGSTTTSNLSVDFTNVGPITESTTYTGKVTDNQNGPVAQRCTTQDSVTLTPNPITPQIQVSGNNNCDGNLTLTGSVQGLTGCNFSWKIDGNSATANNDGTLTFRRLDGVCHTVELTASCSGCSGTATAAIRQCVETEVGTQCAT